MSHESSLPGTRAASASAVPAAAAPAVDRGALERKLLKATGSAVGDFGLIADGDRLLVGLSGGKDSYALLDLLLLLQRRAPVRFTIATANLDPGYPDYRPDVVAEHARSRGVEIHLLKAPVAQLVAEKLRPGQVACPLCSRMRRGALYSLARELGANKLVLGHHLDDALETLLMNLFYAGTLRAMPPLLRRAELPHVIRPLCYALERDLRAYAEVQAYPVIPCASPSCADADRRRQVIKRTLATLEEAHPDLKHQMRRALGNVQPSGLFDRRLLEALGGAAAADEADE
ncbi:MAG: tRNA 2-thiocytidine(32) synthetase TtcA [Deltaproteobacteria bacterium]|nr:tRNA 2-thiocytidine(32) synthetase TtcA [Deltaproteobacteria bacterium]